MCFKARNWAMVGMALAEVGCASCAGMCQHVTSCGAHGLALAWCLCLVRFHQLCDRMRAMQQGCQCNLRLQAKARMPCVAREFKQV